MKIEIDIKHFIQWTHWHEIIPSVAEKCIIIKAFWNWRKILYSDGSTTWTHKKYLISIYDYKE